MVLELTSAEATPRVTMASFHPAVPAPTPALKGLEDRPLAAISGLRKEAGSEGPPEEDRRARKPLLSE